MSDRRVIDFWNVIEFVGFQQLVGLSCDIDFEENIFTWCNGHHRK